MQILQEIKDNSTNSSKNNTMILTSIQTPMDLPQRIHQNSNHVNATMPLEPQNFLISQHLLHFEKS